MKDALRAGATLGEVSDALRDATQNPQTFGLTPDGIVGPNCTQLAEFVFHAVVKVLFWLAVDVPITKTCAPASFTLLSLLGVSWRVTKKSTVALPTEDPVPV